MADVLVDVKCILNSTLQLGARANAFDKTSPLLGGLPEFDSMAVVNLLAALEEHFGFMVDDDEISAETFETLGNLVDFVEQKLSA